LQMGIVSAEKEMTHSCRISSLQSSNTIRKYLRSKDIPESQPRSKRPSQLDPYKSIIDDLIKQGIYNCEH
jgi:transposase